MEEYISNLITNSASFIGSKTLVPGPVEVPLRGTMISSNSHGPSAVQNRQPLAHLPPPSQLQGPIVIATDFNPSSVSAGAPGNSTSILHADLSSMLTWLRTQNQGENSENLMHTQSQAFAPLPSTSTGRGYQVETPRIPKKYIDLTPRDCAGVVARAIRSVILHTCNDNFRQQVFAKLGVSSSHEVERQVKERLIELIAEEEQRREREQSNDTDVENSQQSQVST